MTQSFDLIVIGTGAAGSTVAYACREAGWTVAIIDKRPFGGTCALRGCDPKKVLVGLADVRPTGFSAPTSSGPPRMMSAISLRSRCGPE